MPESFLHTLYVEKSESDKHSSRWRREEAGWEVKDHNHMPLGRVSMAGLAAT